MVQLISLGDDGVGLIKPTPLCIVAVGEMVKLL